MLHDRKVINLNQRSCYSLNLQFHSSTDGEWSSSGCYAVYRNNSFTSCRCNHLTNFAVLLSSASFVSIVLSDFFSAITI